MKISEIKFVTLFIMGFFFSIFLLANNVNLLRTNSYNDEDNFPIDTIKIENAYALELDNSTNSKIVIINDTRENDKNTTANSIAEEIGLEKDSKKEIQDQKGAENNVDFKNTTLQNTALSSSTESPKSIEGGFNFAAVGDWACTSKTKDTVKNIIAQNPKLGT